MANNEVANIGIRLTLDATQFDAGVEKASGKLNKLQRQRDQAGTGAGMTRAGAGTSAAANPNASYVAGGNQGGQRAMKAKPLAPVEVDVTISQQSLAKIKRQVQDAVNDVSVNVTPVVKRSARAAAEDVVSAQLTGAAGSRSAATGIVRSNVRQNLPQRMYGGPVQQGREFLVGERGPEVVRMGQHGWVNPSISQARAEQRELARLTQLITNQRRQLRHAAGGAVTTGMSKADRIAEEQLIEARTYDTYSRMLDHYAQTNPTGFQKSTTWYQRQNAHLNRIANAIGIPLDTAAAIAAEISSNNPWPNNAIDLMRMFPDWRRDPSKKLSSPMATGRNKEKIWQLLQGNGVALGIKKDPFSNALMGDPNGIPADVWMARLSRIALPKGSSVGAKFDLEAAFDKALFEVHGTGQLNKGGPNWTQGIRAAEIRQIHAAVNRIAGERGLEPRGVQAALWDIIRDRSTQLGISQKKKLRRAEGGDVHGDDGEGYGLVTRHEDSPKDDGGRWPSDSPYWEFSHNPPRYGVPHPNLKTPNAPTSGTRYAGLTYETGMGGDKKKVPLNLTGETKISDSVWGAYRDGQPTIVLHWDLDNDVRPPGDSSNMVGQNFSMPGTDRLNAWTADNPMEALRYLGRHHLKESVDPAFLKDLERSSKTWRQYVKDYENASRAEYQAKYPKPGSKFDVVSRRWWEGIKAWSSVDSDKRYAKDRSPDVVAAYDSIPEGWEAAGSVQTHPLFRAWAEDYAAGSRPAYIFTPSVSGYRYEKDDQGTYRATADDTYGTHGSATLEGVPSNITKVVSWNDDGTVTYEYGGIHKRTQPVENVLPASESMLDWVSSEMVAYKQHNWNSKELRNHIAGVRAVMAGNKSVDQKKVKALTKAKSVPAKMMVAGGDDDWDDDYEADHDDECMDGSCDHDHGGDDAPPPTGNSPQVRFLQAKARRDYGEMYRITQEINAADGDKVNDEINLMRRAFGAKPLPKRVVGHQQEGTHWYYGDNEPPEWRRLRISSKAKGGGPTPEGGQIQEDMRPWADDNDKSWRWMSSLANPKDAAKVRKYQTSRLVQAHEYRDQASENARKHGGDPDVANWWQLQIADAARTLNEVNVIERRVKEGDLEWHGAAEGPVDVDAAKRYMAILEQRLSNEGNKAARKEYTNQINQLRGRLRSTGIDIADLSPNDLKPTPGKTTGPNYWGDFDNNIVVEGMTRANGPFIHSAFRNGEPVLLFGNQPAPFNDAEKVSYMNGEAWMVSGPSMLSSYMISRTRTSGKNKGTNPFRDKLSPDWLEAYQLRHMASLADANPTWTEAQEAKQKLASSVPQHEAPIVAEHKRVIERHEAEKAAAETVADIPTAPTPEQIEAEAERVRRQRQQLVDEGWGNAPWRKGTLIGGPRGRNARDFGYGNVPWLSQPQSLKHRAGGGPGGKGTPYIVGEIGPELYVWGDAVRQVPKFIRDQLPRAAGGAQVVGATPNEVFYPPHDGLIIPNRFMHMFKHAAQGDDFGPWRGPDNESWVSRFFGGGGDRSSKGPIITRESLLKAIFGPIGASSRGVVGPEMDEFKKATMEAARSVPRNRLLGAGAQYPQIPANLSPIESNGAISLGAPLNTTIPGGPTIPMGPPPPWYRQATAYREDGRASRMLMPNGGYDPTHGRPTMYRFPWEGNDPLANARERYAERQRREAMNIPTDLLSSARARFQAREQAARANQEISQSASNAAEPAAPSRAAGPTPPDWARVFPGLEARSTDTELIESLRSLYGERPSASDVRDILSTGMLGDRVRAEERRGPADLEDDLDSPIDLSPAERRLRAFARNSEMQRRQREGTDRSSDELMYKLRIQSAGLTGKMLERSPRVVAAALGGLGFGGGIEFKRREAEYRQQQELYSRQGANVDQARTQFNIAERALKMGRLAGHSEEELAGLREDLSQRTRTLNEAETRRAEVGNDLLKAEKAFEPATKNVIRNFGAIVASTSIYGAAFQAATVVIQEAAIPALKKLTEQFLAFEPTSNRVTSALAKQTIAQGNNYKSAVAQAELEAGIGGSTKEWVSSLLEGTTVAKAAANTYSNFSDIFRASIGQMNGEVRGLNTGYGGIMGGPLFAEQMGGGKGLTEQVLSDFQAATGGMDITPYLAGAGVGAAAGAVGGSIIPGIGTATGLGAGGALGLMSTLGPDIINGTVGKKGYQQRNTGIDQMLDYLNNAADRAAQRSGMPLSGGIDWRKDSATARQDAFDYAQRLRSQGAASTITNMAEMGAEFTDEFGNVTDNVATINKYWKDFVATGIPIPDVATWVETVNRQVEASFSALDMQDALNRGLVIPMQLAASRISNPLLNAGAGLVPLGSKGFPTTLPRSATINVASNVGGAFTTGNANSVMSEWVSQGNAMIAQVRNNDIAAQKKMYAEIERVSGKATANKWQGFMDAANAASSGLASLQTTLASLGAEASQAQWANELRLASRAYQDAIGTKAGYKGKGGGSELGQIQGQMQKLAFDLQQRQITTRLALAQFQAPGETGEERYMRQKQALAEAAIQQKQFDYSKGSYEIGLTRNVTDTGAAANIANLSVKAQAATLAAQGLIAGYSANIAQSLADAGSIQDAAIGKISTGQSQIAGFMAQFGGSVGKAVEAFDKVPGPVGQAAAVFTDMYKKMGYSFSYDDAGNINGMRGPGEAPYPATGTKYPLRLPGSEGAVVLRNPAVGSVSTGGHAQNISININNPTVRSEQDITSIAHEVERVIARRGQLLGLRAPSY